MRRALLVALGLLATAGCAKGYVENTLSPFCAQVLARPVPASLNVSPLHWHRLSPAEFDARQEYVMCQDQQRWVQNVPRIYPSGDMQPAPYIPTGPVLCVTLAPGMVSCTR